MKKPSLTALALLAASPLLLADSASVWPTLDIQVASMAQAVQDHSVANLIELEHVVGDEVAGLHRDPGLPAGLSPALDEIAKWAAAASHAAKDGDWKSADTDQQNFARAVQTAETQAAAPAGKKKE